MSFLELWKCKSLHSFISAYNYNRVEQKHWLPTAPAATEFHSTVTEEAKWATCSHSVLLSKAIWADSDALERLVDTLVLLPKRYAWLGQACQAVPSPHEGAFCSFSMPFKPYLNLMPTGLESRV